MREHSYSSVGDMATRARQHQNSFAYELHDHRPYTYLRQSLHRLSRLIDRRRAHTLSRHPLNLALSDLDDTSLSSLSLEKLADAQSVTTFSSNETLDIKTSSADAPNVSTKPSLASIGSANILPFVGGKQAKLALSPSLRKGMDIAQIDIHFQNGQRMQNLLERRSCSIRTMSTMLLMSLSLNLIHRRARGRQCQALRSLQLNLELQQRLQRSI